MKNFWAEILVPATIAGLTLASTVGVETTRAVRLALPLRDSVVRSDTLPPKDSLKPPKDSLSDEFDLFGEAPEDTTPKIYARDTMKVPDSLKVLCAQE